MKFHQFEIVSGICRRRLCGLRLELFLNALQVDSDFWVRLLQSNEMYTDSNVEVSHGSTIKEPMACLSSLLSNTPFAGFYYPALKS